MAETALTELQNQIEAIEREAFAEGYAAAMQAVKELAARSAPQQNDKAAVPNGSESIDSAIEQPEPNRAAIPLRTGTQVRRSPAKRPTGRAATTGRSRSRHGRAKRGTNARIIQEILKAAAPRAMRQAEIRRTLEGRGVSLPYPSIGHALGQLRARKAARQVGKSGTWRYSAAA
jgi:hypothetical protein